jgi:predicted nucleotidyltransferase
MLDEVPGARPDEVLIRLRRELTSVLASELVGVYLFGSLALGDFDPRSSDVDVLVVTEDRLPEVAVSELEAMHARLRVEELPLVEELEVSYLPRSAVRRYDPADAHHPSVGNDWPFGVHWHDASWVVNLHVVRECGGGVCGPPPATLIDPVPAHVLRQAVAGVVEDFWARHLSEPDWLATRKYQAYAVLTMCRALYTLEHGIAVTKQAAADWARESLGPEWDRLIEQALIWRVDRQSAPGDRTESVRFLRFALERSHAAQGRKNEGTTSVG